MDEEHSDREAFVKGDYVGDCHILGLQVFLSCLFLDYFHVGRGFCPFSVLYVATAGAALFSILSCSFQ